MERLPLVKYLNRCKGDGKVSIVKKDMERLSLVKRRRKGHHW